MKKLAILTAAACLIATPAIAAPDRGHQYNTRSAPAHVAQHYTSSENKRWSRGERFDRRYARNYTVISAPPQHGLRAAPRGYNWVRSGNDAVLVGITSGIVASVILNSFR